MKRLFIAIKLKKTREISTLFSRLKSDLTQERIKWVDPRGLHLTLAFLGETPNEALPAIHTELKRLIQKFSPFSLQLKSLGAFPPKKRPRILWAGVASDPLLFTLQRAVVKAMDPLVPIQDKRFVPHLTLGRIKGGVKNPSRVQESLTRHGDWEDTPIHIHQIVLMESQLRPQGPLYTVVEKFKLPS